MTDEHKTVLDRRASRGGFRSETSGVDLLRARGSTVRKALLPRVLRIAPDDGAFAFRGVTSCAPAIAAPRCDQ